MKQEEKLSTVRRRHFTGGTCQRAGRRGRSLFVAFDAVPVQKEDMPERPDAVPMTLDTLFAPLDSPLVVPDALSAPPDEVFARAGRVRV